MIGLVNAVSYKIWKLEENRQWKSKLGANLKDCRYNSSNCWLIILGKRKICDFRFWQKLKTYF